MKLKSEAKIGIIVLVTIALVVWGINFLKGKNVLERSDLYYTVFPNVQGLEKSASIYINGYKIGMINDIQFEKGNLENIMVSFAVHHDFDIPKGSVAELYNTSLVGSKAIQIIPSSSKEYYTYGDTLPARVETDMITALQNQIEPLTTKAESAMVSADSLLRAINEVMDSQRKDELKSSIDNLSAVSSSLKNQLGPQGDLNKTIEELQKFSQTLSENRGRLDTVFANLASLSDSIGQANVKQTLTSIDKTFAQSSVLLGKINNGEGTLGMLATNDSLYNYLKSSTESLNLLLDDLREHPKRYVHFSLFGKKDKVKK